LDKLVTEQIQAFATSLFTFANKVGGAIAVFGVSAALQVSGTGREFDGSNDSAIGLIVIPSLALCFTACFAVRSRVLAGSFMRSGSLE